MLLISQIRLLLGIMIHLLINNTHNVSSTAQRLGSGNLNYNPASLVARIFNNNEGEEE